MRLFGWEVTRPGREKALAPVPQRGGGWYRIFESFAGAWQRNVEISFDTALSFYAVFACTTLAASDIAKLRLKLVQQDNDGIWTEVRANSPFKPVLRKPNPTQTRIQFFEAWVLSKLLHGNAYVLKQRDSRGIVVALYVLDPARVTVLVSDSGSVFYQVQADTLAGRKEAVTIPASEVIHDRFNCLFHPLVGTSPIYAAGHAASAGLAIQANSAKFFANRGIPSGILSAEGAISNETAARLKEAWEANYTGNNSGKIAVLGDGLKFEAMSMTAVDAQTIEQLKMSGEVVCSVYHIPPYKVGIGPMPNNNNIQALNVEYYSQCLQRLIEDIELCLDEGLGLDEPKDGRMLGTEFDLDGLLRMDSVTQMSVLKEAIGAAVMAPNEARRKLDLPPVKGGESPMIQQQNYSLAALAKRDAKEDPFGSASSSEPAPTADSDDDEDDGEERTLIAQAALVRALEPPRLALSPPV